MKILQLNPAFYPAFSYGGVVAVSYDLSKALTKRGHDVTVYTSDTLDKKNREKNHYLEHQGIKIYYFRNVSNILAWHRFLFYPGLIMEVKNHIHEFDIVHMHGIRNFQNIVASHYAKKYGIPYVVQPHGSLPLLLGKKTLKRIYDAIWGEKILKGADWIIALTPAEAEHAKQMGIDESRIRIIANGIDLSQYENVPALGEFRMRYGISSEARIILFLGRLNPIKRVDLLIRAFHIVLKEIDNCVLVIAGPDDGSLSELKVLVEELRINENVIFTGPIHGNIKSATYQDSDIFVIPSYHESFPMTLLEAWKFKKPVIVTDSCEINNIVNDCGLIVKPNPGDMATALKLYLKQDILMRSHGQNGYEKLHNNFTMCTTAQGVERLYYEVIRSKSYK